MHFSWLTQDGSIYIDIFTCRNGSTLGQLVTQEPSIISRTNRMSVVFAISREHRDYPSPELGCNLLACRARIDRKDLACLANTAYHDRLDVAAISCQETALSMRSCSRSAKRHLIQYVPSRMAVGHMAKHITVLVKRDR